MREFKKLRIWNDGYSLVKEVYQISSLLPESEKFGLCNQIKRASISIVSNIAEGASRESEKDKARFLELALGSAFELETQIMLIRDLELVKTNHFDSLLAMISKEQASIFNFRSKLMSGNAK